MPRKSFTVVMDYSHGELLNLSDPEFRPFAELLDQMDCYTVINSSGKINDKLLENADLLIMGCPINHYLLGDEIKNIVDFVMNGGSLLVASEYGGDCVQKTNLNDLTSYFGIYFENTAVRTKKEETGSTSLPMITEIIDHELTKNIKKIVLGGTCSLRTAKDAVGIFLSGKDTWIEIYDNLNNAWIKNDDVNIPLIAITTYGQGRVVAFGDIDIFGANPEFGLNTLDNKRVIQNIFNWFSRPVKQDTTIDWLLGQISVYREDILQIKMSFNNLIDSIKSLDQKVELLSENHNELHLKLENHIQKDHSHQIFNHEGNFEKIELKQIKEASLNNEELEPFGSEIEEELFESEEKKKQKIFQQKYKSQFY
jgi:hypothetical protein